MTIAARATARRRRGMAAENVIRQHRAEVRMDELTVVHDVRVQYEKVDRSSDLRMESHFQAMWALADDEEERDAIARAFAEWGKGEQLEGMAVEQAVSIAIETLKRNNPLWLHDGCGPDGAAA